MDEIFAATVPPEYFAETVYPWVEATSLARWDACELLLAPGCQGVSHQLLGPSRISGAGLIRWFRELDEGSMRMITPEIHAVSPVGLAFWEEFQQLDDGGFFVSNGGVSLVSAHDRTISGFERFDDDQLPTVLDRLDAMAANAGVDVMYVSEPARLLRGEAGG